MEFRNVVCWHPDQAIRVTNTEALQVVAHFFRATHHPVMMRRVSKMSGLEGEERLTQERFVEEFLDSRKDHSQSVVLGATGSGKSHFVRWLRAAIPETPQRRVVLIPRVGTNLRRVIELILEGLEGVAFDEYRNRVRNATATLDLGLAREELLNNLAVAVGPYSQHAHEEPDEDARAERDYLTRKLPRLLYDAAFRDFLNRDGGILEQLAQQAVGETGAQRLESRHRFALSDFELDEWEIDETELGGEARDIYRRLRDSTLFREAAVAWMNRNLDDAVARLLQLNREDLPRLMEQVRHTLAQQGKELVLLIEDFAKLQGIDRELLEALQARPLQDGRRLCVLRSVIAMPIGFYQALMPNVRDRMDLVVNLDLEGVGAEREVSTRDIAEFASRYLNATRVPEPELVAWAERGLASGNVPNACLGCDYIKPCHDAFGDHDGVGLYPFTREALDRMFALANRDMGTHFNPRRLLNGVLQHILANYADALREGAFPPAALLPHFTRGEMPSYLYNRLKSRVPHRADQYRVLYELWGSPQQLDSVPDSIVRAFGLRPLPGDSSRPAAGQSDQQNESTGTGPFGDRTPAERTPPERPAGTAPISAEALRLRKQLDELDRWANGGILGEDLAERLRDRLLGVLEKAIDWDSEFLVGDTMVGKERDRPLQPTSFYFERQNTQPKWGRNQVRLHLPLNGDFTLTAMALQALLRFQHQPDLNWDFEGGAEFLRAYGECLDQWTQEVLRQVRALPAAGETWDPVPAVTEILAIGARLSGNLPPGSEGVPEVINALYRDWREVAPAADQFGSETLADLIRAYASSGNRLLEILRARAACTKGGEAKFQIVNAAALAGPLRRLRTTWLPAEPLPECLSDEYRCIAEMRQHLEALVPAVVTEKRIWLAAHDEIRKSVPEGTLLSEVVAVLDATGTNLVNAGIWPEQAGDRRTFEAQLQAVRDLDCDEALREIRQLESSQGLPEVLAIVSRRDLRDTLRRTLRFVRFATHFLDSSDQRVSGELERRSGVADSVRESGAKIEKGIRGLRQWCGEIAGGQQDVDGEMHGAEPEADPVAPD